MFFRDYGRRGVLLAIHGASDEIPWSGTSDLGRQQHKRLDTSVVIELPARGSRQLVVKLPSPVVPDAEAATLAAIDYDRAREETLKFWTGYVSRGARFEVPEAVINDLFRASLWHALRLPRRRACAGAASAGRAGLDRRGTVGSARPGPMMRVELVVDVRPLLPRSAMARIYNMLVFDRFIRGTAEVFTAPGLDEAIGRADDCLIEVEVSEATATTPTLTLKHYHSCSGEDGGSRKLTVEAGVAFTMHLGNGKRGCEDIGTDEFAMDCSFYPG